MQRHKERAFGARLIGVVVAAVCGLAAGCGGSGSNETASSSTNASGASSDIQPPTPTKDVATNATDVPTYVLVAVGEAASEDQESFTLLADLNENGTVVGELIRVLNLQDERPRQGSFAFVWRDGQLDELGALHSLVHDSRAQGINDFDEIVGWSYPGTDAQPAFVWRNGQMTPLDLADAYAVNNSGQVVGYATQVRGNEASSMAVVWHSGQVTELRELANPWNINDAGDVVGFSLINSTPRASLFRAGTVTILGTLPGASASQAFDINEVGQVVGTSHFSPADGSDGYDRAFLWEDGRMRELEPLSSDDKADAYGINDRGVVVGRSGASQFVAVIWLDGAPYDLNALIAEDDPLRPFVTLLEARGINNRGEIIAQGIDARRPGAYTGYVLKPK
jgi:probable HAF family extracellular repeat protein